MKSFVAPMGALALAALAFAWNLVSTTGSPPTPVFLVLALAAVVLEAGAVALPGFSFFSASSACVVALALTPSGGSAAALTALAALAVRTLTRGLPTAGGRLRELATDLLPLQLTVALALVAPGLARLALMLVYPLLWLLVAGRLRPKTAHEQLVAWRSMETTQTLLRGGLVAVGIALASLGQSQLLSLVLFLPFLGAAHLAIDNIGYKAQARSARVVREQLEASQRALDQATNYIGQTKKELADSEEEKALLNEFVSHVTISPDVNSTLALILKAARRAAPSRTIALFLVRKSRLSPVAFLSPLRERLDSVSLLRLREPIVEQCFRSRLLTQLNDRRNTDRIFVGESEAVALPLQDLGVLYLGREEQPFSQEELRTLWLLSGKAGLALQSSQRYERIQEALKENKTAREALEQWVGRLGVLLEGSRAMVSRLETDRFLDELEKLASKALPGSFGVVETRSGRRYWGASRLDQEAFEALLQTVQRDRQPLVLDDLGNSRFTPPLSGMVSLMLVPLLDEQEFRGVILVGSKRPQAYDRESLDLLRLISFQAVVALANSSLFRELEESQAQLIRSSKMAAVGQLAAGVAHELNSPLGAITLSVDAATRSIEKDPEKALARLQRARRAADHARSIIAKLLLYAGDVRERKQIEPIQLARATWDLLEHQLALDGIEAELDWNPAPPFLGNPNELQQVLSNLLLNARDALLDVPEGQRRLRFFCEDRGGRVRFGVQDYGPGIKPEDLSHVFDPFFTTKPVGQGTGLGLSVSQLLVESNGGTLSVESEPGKGATFIVELPPAA